MTMMDNNPLFDNKQLPGTLSAERGHAVGPPSLNGLRRFQQQQLPFFSTST